MSKRHLVICGNCGRGFFRPPAQSVRITLIPQSTQSAEVETTISAYLCSECWPMLSAALRALGGERPPYIWWCVGPEDRPFTDRELAAIEGRARHLAMREQHGYWRRVLTELAEVIATLMARCSDDAAEQEEGASHDR